MKKNTKKGLTLAELLVAVGIIGILVALSLQVKDPVQKSATKYLYMNAYQALLKAFYNGSLKGYDPFSTQTDSDGNTPVFTSTIDSGAKTLCRGLTTYINTNTNVKTDDEDYSESCSDTKLTSELADDFDTDNIQFTANNEMDFYISKKLSTSGGLEFYLVFVDLNGANKAPNSIVYTYKGGKEADDYPNTTDGKKQKEKDKILPDIYAFALLDTGRICPIGIPEYDTNVLTARVAFFDSSGNVVYDSSANSMAYYQAKGAAWGFYSSSSVNTLTDYNDDEPFSVNDIVRNAINSNSKILEDFPTLSSLSPVNLTNSTVTIDSEEVTPQCAAADYEACYVFLDTYRQY